MSPEAQARNETIIASIESFGGGVVWEPEIFAITLIRSSSSPLTWTLPSELRNP